MSQFKLPPFQLPQRLQFRHASLPCPSKAETELDSPARPLRSWWAHPTLLEHHSYDCPICRTGQIQPMVLMDAYACNFCRHIFGVDEKRQVVQVMDSVHANSWRWKGKSWQTIYPQNRELSLTIWLAAVAIALIPSLLVWLPMQIFPSGLEDAWFPKLWLGLTVSLHGLISAWLLLEHYQLQNYVSLKIRWQDWAAGDRQ
jgi:hypothetical protein